MDLNKLEEAKFEIKQAKKIVFFGGAGVSTRSGIPDFRGKEGLYRLQSMYGVPYEVILSHSYYERNADTFFDFYKNFMIHKEAKPNDAHYALAHYEKIKSNLCIITQNIDNLHQEAGSKNVLELHGSIHRNYCEKCNKFYSLDEILSFKGVPICSCGGRIKPDVVLYEEQLDYNVLSRSIEECSSCDVLIIGGTSLNVYPAASLVRYFKGRCLIMINKEATSQDCYANYVFHEDIAKVLPLLLDLED